MLSSARRIAKLSKTAIVGFHILENWKSSIKLRSGDSSSAALPHADFGDDVNAAVAHVNDTYDSYIRNSSISSHLLDGARVLEVGPGDNFGVALTFLANGARQVVCLDRFLCIRDPAHERAIYESLRAGLSEERKRRFDDAVRLDGEIRFNPERLRYIPGVGLEEASAQVEPGSFDLIVSMAVLEHVYDSAAAFREMDKLLRLGGSMLHGVDFRDHGLFSSGGHHPLTFLTIEDGVYRLMSSHSGLPNRNLIDFYRDALAGMNYEFRIMKARVVGESHEINPHKAELKLGEDYSDATLSLLQEIRPKLLSKFRAMSDDDLMVSAMFFVARKPA